MAQSQIDPTVSEEFSKRKKRQIIAAVPATLMIILLLAAEKAGPEGLASIPIFVLGPVAIATIFAVVAFSLINWRCPSCKKYLGKRISPRFCAKCGVQLQA
jgi:hypothetical protein